MQQLNSQAAFNKGQGEFLMQYIDWIIPRMIQLTTVLVHCKAYKERTTFFVTALLE